MADPVNMGGEPKARAKPEKGSVRSGRGRVRRVIVVGSGAAGLMTALELCRRRVPVLLLSQGPAARSPSAWSRSGLNACARIDGDDQALHLKETLACGAFRAPQPPVNAMIEAAPSLLDELVRMGVPFDRSPEGSCARLRLPGSTRARTALSGMATGLLAVGSLDEQLRRLEGVDLSDERGLSVPGERMLQRLEGWDLVRLVLDDNGVVVGIVAQELRSMKIRALPADAVCLATGGASGLFARSTAGTESSGAAAGTAFLQGAVWANGELVQFHPTTFFTADKPRPIAEIVRAAGARLWLPKNPQDTRHPHDIPDRERDYFLDRMFPRFAELVPADLATRAIVELFDQGRGLNDSGRPSEVYLDVSHLDRASIEELLGPMLDAYVKLTGDHPLARPMRVAPAPHATLGGLWVDYEATSSGVLLDESARNQATSLPGLYAAGDVEYQYHGACRLDGNALLARLFAGRTAGAAMTTHRRALARSAFDLPSSVFEKAEGAEQGRFDEIVGRTGGASRSPFELVAELGEALLEGCGPQRSDDALDRLLERVDELEALAGETAISDATSSMNRSALMARKLEALLAVARVIGSSARQRGRSAAGASENGSALSTTLARHAGRGQVQFVHDFEYRALGRAVRVSDRVDTSLVAPQPRGYEEK